MTKIFGTLVALVALLGVFSFSTYAQGSEKIENYDVHLTVNPDGTVTAVERITYDFGTLQKHGIFRTIPFVKTNEDGDNFKLKFDDFLVKDADGNDVMFDIQKASKEHELKIGDPDKFVTGKKDYLITYTITGALTYFSDHDELYWNAVGTEWPVPIENATVTVKLPTPIAASQLLGECYTGVFGATQQNCLVSTDFASGQAIYTAANLAPYTGLTVVAGFPKGLVAVLEPEKYVSTESILLTLYILAVTLVNTLIPAVFIIKWNKIVANFNAKKRIVTAWFDPPKNTDGTFYTPAETAYLVHNKFSNKIVAATIIDLARRGFLTISIQNEDRALLPDKTEVVFIKNVQADAAELTKHEFYIYDGLFGNKLTETTLTSLKKNTAFGTKMILFNSELKKSLTRKNMYFGSIWTEVAQSWIAVFSLFFMGVGFAIAYTLYGRKVRNLSDLGIEKYSEGYSLLNFLVSQDEHFDFQAKEQMFFEKLLPYATAFGVEDVWIKRFGNLINLTDMGWYQNTSGTNYAFGSLASNISSGVGSSDATSTRSSSGFSRGGGGGGSSGCGGAGAGGGSR